jgi:hypothetical protein
MPIDPADAIGAVQEGLSQVPSAVLAIVLLAGPTSLWLFYRFFVQPRRSRYTAGRDELVWACVRCLSVNDIQSGRCYACGLEREIALEEARRADPGVAAAEAVAAEPPAAEPAAASAVIAAAEPAAAEVPVAPPAPPSPVVLPPRRLVAVGPGRGVPTTSAASVPLSADGEPSGEPVSPPARSRRRHPTRTEPVAATTTQPEATPERPVEA